MYAQLCKRLSKEAPNFERENNPCTFRLLLLNKCRAEFENRSKLDDGTSAITPEDEERRQLAKRKMLGNIKFIGELAKLEILSESILHRCIQQLLEKRRRSDTSQQEISEDLECLCQILRTCGRILDTDKGSKLMEQYFERMKVLAENLELPPRIRFMLKDVIELRKDGWVPRKATIVEGPMPIHQIRPSDDNSRSASYLMHERRNHEKRGEMAAANNELFRHRINMRSGMEDIMAGISITSSSTNLIPLNPNGFGSRDNYRSQRSAYGGYGNQRGAYKHNQNNNNLSSSSNKDLAPRFKKNLIYAARDCIGDVELRPAPNSMLFNQASVKAAAALVPLNKPVVELKPAITPVSTVLHKDALSIKQAVAEKPKQTKKDKGPSKEEILKKVGVLMEEFLQNSMTVEMALDAYREFKVPDKFIKDLLLNMLKLTLHKPESDCLKMIKLMNMLRTESLILGHTVQDAMKSFCNMLDDTDTDEQKNKEAVSRMLACSVREHLVTLSDLGVLTEGGAHHPLFLQVLQQLRESMPDRQELSRAFTASKVNLLNHLPEQERNKERLAEILDERDLTFLCPLLRIQAELAKQLHADPQPQQLYKWIKEHLDVASTADAGFVNALMTALFKYILQEAGTAVADPNDKVAQERERVLLERFTAVLQQFLQERVDLQVTAVYSLQAHWFSLGHPKGLLLRWFNALYDLEVIEEEAFLQWKDDPPDAFPGKGQALFQVNQWLTWLQEAESDNDELDD